MSYEPGTVEPKWQRVWEERKTFQATEDPAKKKYYCLEMFPYPSGRIHMGHVRNYTIGDVVARYKKMRGFNVLHPMGWDAFGLPAENAAIENQTHPALWTRQNIDTMRRQLKRMGLSYDWHREISTSDPEYYRWEQLVFLKMWEKGLAYKKQSLVNWCDRCETVLANEQVEGGVCWRCESPVRMKQLDQWFLKITAYAEELLQGTYDLPGWPERVLTMQREWIGRSEGARVCFPIEGRSGSEASGFARAERGGLGAIGGPAGAARGPQQEGVLEVFTTRPGTLYGATFVSLAAEHPLALALSQGTPQEAAVRRFAERTAKMDRGSRLKGEYEKEGVFTGGHCLNPVNGRRLSIWAANFVLMEYGTGAVMAVPAHDQRDFEFAKKYALPIVVVIQPSAAERLDPLTMREASIEPGVMDQSGPFDGMRSEVGQEKITQFLADKGWGGQATTYKLRDWGISRQRYWGAPIPILTCPNCGMIPVPEKDLPVVLPTNVKLSGKGGSPLARVKDFLETPCPRCEGTARRETDTMDTFVESSWYFLRYCSPAHRVGPFASDAAQYWMPVDQYIGGIEHAVLHLLYARFYTKVLRDLGFVQVSEPFTNLLTQGMVIKDGAKMSKSRGNVVDPDSLMDRYGADTVRLFSLFAAPPERDLDWSDQGVQGSSRFLARVWRFLRDPGAPTPSAKRERVRHRTIKKVTQDLERFHFNTAIAALMEYLNFLEGERTGGLGVTRDEVETFIRLLSPFAPHMAEELWSLLGHPEIVSTAPWPSYDPSLLEEESALVVIQVNGTVRGKIVVSRGCGEEEVVRKALGEEKVRQYVEKKKIVRHVYVKDKLINLVCS